jgi:hypothetical protein
MQWQLRHGPLLCDLPSRLVVLRQGQQLRVPHAYRDVQLN